MRVLLSVLICGSVCAQSITLPPGSNSADAVSSIAYDYGERSQFVYPASHFVGVSGPISITSIRVRAEAGVASSAPSVLSNFFYLSRAQPILGPAFQANYLDEPFRGFGSRGLATIGGSPNDDTVEFLFDPPFVFDPTAGHGLLLDWFGPAQVTPPRGPIPVWDAAVGTGATRVTALLPSTTGTVDDTVPVITIGYLDGGYADVARLGLGCGAGATRTTLELFTGLAPFDLAGTSWTASLSAPGYSLQQSNEAIVAPTGAPLSFSTGDIQQVTLPWTLPHPDGSTQSLWVHADGVIALESVPSLVRLAPMLGMGVPLVMPGWVDPVDPNSGTIHAELDPSDPNLFHVTWTNVLDASTAASNTFQASFHADGSVDCRYGSVGSVVCFVGITAGAGRGVYRQTQLDFSVDLATPWQQGEDHRLLVIDFEDDERPVMGTTFDYELNEIALAATVGVMWFGWNGASTGIDLTAAGMPGCDLFVPSPFAAVPLSLGGMPSRPGSLSIPTAPILSGRELYMQAAAAPTVAVEPTPIATSNGLRLLIYEN